MKLQRLRIALFFAVLIIAAMFTFLLPKNERSELENRTLQAAPVLSLQNVLDKSFMTDAEKYMTDHFVGRIELIKAKNMLELAQGKKEINSVFIDDEMLLLKVPPPSDSAVNKSIKAINEFAQKYEGQIQTSVAIIPTAIEMYPQNTTPFADTLNQSQFINNFYSRLIGTNNIDIYSSMLAEADNYIYYRTDHHWTSYGAYVGYTAMGNALGFTPVANSEFNIQHISYDFLGTLYSKVLCKENLADTVDLYTYSKYDAVSQVIKYEYYSGQNPIPVSFESVHFKEYLDTKDKYAVFLGKNEPVVRITTKALNDKKIILFKDSYSNALMQYLPLHFSEIVLVDLRYIKLPLYEYVDINDYSNAMFIYNIAGLIDDTTISKVTLY